MFKNGGLHPNERTPHWLVIATFAFAAACSDQSRVAAPNVRPVEGAMSGVSASGYTATELLPAPGYNSAKALGVNDASVVVGISWNEPPGFDTDRATKWVNGQPTLLAAYPNQIESRAFAINAAGRIVGQVDLNSGGSITRAVMWTGNTVAALPFVGNGASAQDINDAGVVVGWESDRSGTRAVKWIDGGRVVLDPPGSSGSLALAVNSHGEAVGLYKATPNEEEVAIVWRADGSWFTLPPPYGGIECFALDVNQSLNVVGTCTLAVAWWAWTPLTGVRNMDWAANAISPRYRVVGGAPGPGYGIPVTQRQTTMDTLPNPGGSTTASGRGVNSCGSVVGTFSKWVGSGYLVRPVLWTKPTCDPVIGPS